MKHREPQSGSERTAISSDCDRRRADNGFERRSIGWDRLGRRMGVRLRHG